MMQTEWQDSEVVSEFLQTRREDLFLKIYKRHTPSLYLFALRLTGGKHHDAEDVVQESWIRAIRKLESFRQDAKLINWLMGIACNCYREMIRDGRPLRGFCQEEIISQPSTDLEQLIRRLPAGCREVLVLHDLYGYTHEETASALKIHPGTSKSQLFEARKKLRAWLFKEKK
jgi:RNA polymerase sigma factor (sigma-70 family)